MLRLQPTVISSWYVRRMTEQPPLSFTVKSRRLSFFGHLACMAGSRYKPNTTHPITRGDSLGSDITDGLASFGVELHQTTGSCSELIILEDVRLAQRFAHFIEPHWKGPSRSLKVTELSVIRYISFDFVFIFDSNYARTLCRYRDPLAYKSGAYVTVWPRMNLRRSSVRIQR